MKTRYINGLPVREKGGSCPTCKVSVKMWCKSWCKRIDIMDYR